MSFHRTFTDYVRPFPIIRGHHISTRRTKRRAHQQLNRAPSGIEGSVLQDRSKKQFDARFAGRGTDGGAFDPPLFRREPRRNVQRSKNCRRGVSRFTPAKSFTYTWTLVRTLQPRPVPFIIFYDNFAGVDRVALTEKRVHPRRRRRRGSGGILEERRRPLAFPPRGRCPRASRAPLRRRRGRAARG